MGEIGQELDNASTFTLGSAIAFRPVMGDVNRRILEMMGRTVCGRHRIALELRGGIPYRGIRHGAHMVITKSPGGH